MNKELIKKYKIEFDHWLNGGKLLAKFVYDQWVKAPKDIFSSNMVNFVLVIDDEYVEYRKALAEGKSIECYKLVEEDEFDSSKDVYKWVVWKSATPSSSFTKTLKYRIKLEDFKFKVGDWVVYKGEGYCKGEILQITNIDEKGFCTFGSYDKLYHFDKLRPWKPKPGEWCWVYNNKDDIPIIRKFVRIDNELNTCLEEDNTIPRIYITGRTDGKYTCNTYYRYIEPFIGVLPSTIEQY